MKNGFTRHESDSKVELGQRSNSNSRNIKGVDTLENKNEQNVSSNRQKKKEAFVRLVTIGANCKYNEEEYLLYYNPSIKSFVLNPSKTKENYPGSIIIPSTSITGFVVDKKKFTINLKQKKINLIMAKKHSKIITSSLMSFIHGHFKWFEVDINETEIREELGEDEDDNDDNDDVESKEKSSTKSLNNRIDLEETSMDNSSKPDEQLLQEELQREDGHLEEPLQEELVQDSSRNNVSSNPGSEVAPQLFSGGFVSTAEIPIKNIESFDTKKNTGNSSTPNNNPTQTNENTPLIYGQKSQKGACGCCIIS